MADFGFSLLHNFEPMRDSYGFALRPQHAQSYRQYASIYKEEEGERADKWRGYLEQIVKSSQSCSSENELEEISQAKGSEIKEGTSSRSRSEGNDLNIRKSCEGTELEDETGAESVSEGNDLSFKKSCEGTKVEEETGAEWISEENDLSGRKSFKVIEIKEGTNLERQRESDESSDWSAAEGTEIKEGTSLARVSERNDSINKKYVSDGSTASSSEKEVHCPEERKARKVQTWGEIRPSLAAIEKLMSNRVKKAKKIEVEQANGKYDNLPCIDESEHLQMVSEDIIEEKVFPKEMLDNSINGSREGDALEDHDSPEFYSQLKELESLVQGGVPKDLRGEIWQAFVGVKTRRVESYYDDLLAQETDSGKGKELDDSSCALGKWRKQIEKDIPRTFPGHPALDENGRNSLRRLLLAYARHNPSVGYCQAMNFFAGLLLLLMPEENAFWALVGIIDDYFEGYYTEEMVESQVDQLVFEELMRERFPKLVNHLDYLGVQVAWITGPWFLSIFVNMIPWESVLRVWDVLLFEGNRVTLFRTALALMELYGPALVTTKDAGDAITLLQSLAGSTFDSSQLVFTACVSFLAVTEARLQELREKHRPSVLVVVEERSKKGRVWKDSKGLASKLYSFKHDPGSLVEEMKTTEGGDMENVGDKSPLESHSSNLDELLNSLNVDSEVDSLPDLQEQVVWLKVELCRMLEEKRSAIIRAEELETALMEMVKQDNRRELSARVEQLEQEVAELQQALADKKLQEGAMLQVLMRVEQEQKVTEDARRRAEQDLAAQKYVVHMLQEKYDKAMASIKEMEKRVVMAESMLEATLQYESGQSKALSPRGDRIPSPRVEIPAPKLRLLNFGLGWRDRNKGKPTNEEECSESQSNDEGRSHCNNDDAVTRSREFRD
ncbi:GTPase-activating protein GYP2-like isoform X1 [Prosopis cineraria]|uniref:GTPase-activating protein GYP2-like isoform X1 n=1 Tax=Prosopis cineraria TaxID=364024 RepID=UPI00240FC6FD|nr:GTPase-activating protein GYP2-like isoform X1 [Prosopis cineraria]